MSHTLRRGLVGLLTASALALIVAGAAGAAVTPVANDAGGATAIANAMAATPGVVTGAAFVAAPPNDSPNGTADSVLTQFPTNGSTFGILTSGSVANVDDPGLFTNVQSRRRERSREHRLRRLDPPDRPHRPDRFELPDVRLQVPVRGVPVLRRLPVQRRVHRRTGHLDLDDCREHHHRSEQLRVRRVAQRRQCQLDRHRRNVDRPGCRNSL